MDRWQKMQEEIGVFTDKTFGTSTPRAKALHLAEEAQEAADDPADIIEWADCIILLLDGVRKAGYTTDDLYDAVQRKMEINKNRTWGKADKDGVVRHKKDVA
ncbi:MAG: DUF550 domain-containing protein [Alphaproteobacteria bacterium]|nr:DUF550 domain-containing protein [Alphaproteobacteria bacterium]